MMWGKLRESGIWKAKKSQFRFKLVNHDTLYIAIRYFRLRLMKRGT